MGDDYQYDLFRKPRQRPTILCDDFSLYDDIMPNFTPEALRDLAASGERDEENPFRQSGPRWLIKGPKLKKSMEE